MSDSFFFKRFKDTLLVSASISAAVSFAALEARYKEPQRRYHTLDHIMDCLCIFDQVRQEVFDRARRNGGQVDLMVAVVVELALWYHDAVYDPRRKDNEAQSAAVFAKHAVQAGLEPALVDRVTGCILATQHRVPPGTLEEQFVVDIDLSILGREESVFDVYERGIREEYAHIDGPAFCAGRTAFLRGILARETIYATSYFRARFEAPARANIVRSIARMELDRKESEEAEREACGYPSIGQGYPRRNIP